jgi:sigma-B regulation protein RsbU (phosphoserine phosphatase)
MIKLLRILYFLVPVLILAIFVADLLSYYSNIKINFVSYLRELIILSLIFLCYQIVKVRFHFDELTIEQNLIRLIILIIANFVIAILINIIFETRYTAGFPASYDSASAVLVSTIFAFIASFTLVPAFFILKQLIFYKRKRYTALFFKSFLVMITANALSAFFSKQPVGWLRFNTESLANDITFAITLLLVIILSFRNEWITYLSRKKKILYFFIGLPVYGAFASLFDIAYRVSLPAYSLTIAALGLNLWIFLLIYGGFALLKLLFHLPTARAFDRKIRELNSLYDLARTLNNEIKTENLYPLITKLTSEILESQCTWLSLVDHANNKLRLTSQINLTSQEIENIPLLTFNALNTTIISKKDATLINDVPHNRQYKYLIEWKKNARTILGAPLFSNRGQLMGIIYATKSKEYTFDIDDASLIQGIANQAAIAIENTNLLQESIERERLEQELKIARDVQLKLLPQTIPQIKNFDVDAFCLNAYEVGGDYYDFFHYADGKPGIVIGDVSGKGMSAALYMAEFKGIVQTLAKSHTSPYELACNTNKIIYPNIERRSFISAIIAKIEPDTNTFKFARAGHTSILICIGNKRNPKNILTKGIGLGLDSGDKFNDILEEKSVHLKGNGTIILYTDGVTEARNGDGLEFGEERLTLLLKSCRAKTAMEIKENLLSSVLDFCGKTQLHDDLTFVILKNCLNLHKPF